MQKTILFKLPKIELFWKFNILAHYNNKWSSYNAYSQQLQYLIIANWYVDFARSTNRIRKKLNCIQTSMWKFAIIVCSCCYGVQVFLDCDSWANILFGFLVEGEFLDILSLVEKRSWSTTHSTTESTLKFWRNSSALGLTPGSTRRTWNHHLWHWGIFCGHQKLPLKGCLTLRK